MAAMMKQMASTSSRENSVPCGQSAVPEPPDPPGMPLATPPSAPPSRSALLASWG